MPLSPGSHLGPYEVLALLGAGGMGEVYRARDPRLDREVAIKVLPHDRVADESRRQRFLQEAKAASALNHPHIVTIYEIESADGIDFLVMEYVRGKSLDALIPRQGMRLGEALRIAIAIADAVAGAHAHNIVHRDLKPANVMVGTDGAVKVLDFGLAKLLTDDKPGPDDQTRAVDEGLTKRGAVMGTLAYMSPEQASGETVDVRSDVFSFGAMLYEMVTGVGPFTGKTPTDTLAAVLSAQPKAPTELVPRLPHELERLILRCLRREPGRRFQNMADVKVDLQEIKEESDSAPGRLTLPARQRLGRVWLVAAALVGVVVVTLGVWRMWRAPVPPISEPSPEVLPLTTLSGYEANPSFSPDGEQVAFNWDEAGNAAIYIKLVGSADVRRLTLGTATDIAPSWSSDGKQIAFLRCKDSGTECRIYVTSPIGGSPRRVSDFVAYEPIGWSPDSRSIVASRAAVDGSSDADASGIFLIPATGGEPRRILQGQPSKTLVSPTYAADGRSLAYAACGNNIVPPCTIEVVGVDTSYAPTSPPQRVTEAVSVRRLVWTRDDRFIVYDGGTLPFRTFLWRVAVDGHSPPSRVELAGFGGDPATTGSKNRLAFRRDLSDEDIYRLATGGSPEAVVTSTYADIDPEVSPDNHQIAFSSGRSGELQDIWIAGMAGEGARQVTHGPGRWQGSPSWSPDGKRLAFDSFGANGHWHIWAIDAEGGEARQLTTAAGDQNVGKWSHDGKWLYYSADDGAGRDVWRMSLASGLSARVTNGGTGYRVCISTDDRNIVFQRRELNANAPLMIAPTSGGTATQLLGCVHSWGFATGPSGVYYAACDSESEPTLHVIDPTSRLDRVLGRLNDFLNDLTVSPDERTILYGRLTNPSLRHGRLGWSADLMLIENFK